MKRKIINDIRRGLRKTLTAASLLCFGIALMAQNTVTGTVGDENGALSGATVTVKGTNIGVLTGSDGTYSVNVPAGDVTLVFSLMGFVTREVGVGGRTVIDVRLAEETTELTEVIVTALGIKRSEKALGYAVQKMDGEKLSIVKGVNVETSLTGKISGLNVKGSTEFARNPSIELRGATPLLVIDGVPHAVTQFYDVPADNIESIDVLKGSTASALYGARGGSGAIMITTKKAKKEGLEVTVNSNTMFHAGFLKIPEVQNSYSGGANGKYAPGDYVWGDKLDVGRTAVQYDPVTYEWREMPLTSKGKDNFRNFLQQALVLNNNVSVAQKGKYGGFRVSLNHIYNRGQYLNADQQRFAFSTGGNIDYGKFHLDAGITYTKGFFTNDNGIGYNVGSYMYNMLIWTGAEYDLREYRSYWRAGKEHSEQNWMTESWYDNPYFLAFENRHSEHRDLAEGYVNMSFEITDWLKAQARIGADYSVSRQEWVAPVSTRNNLKGQYRVGNYSPYSTNNDVMLIADKKFGDFSFDGFVGGSIFLRVHNEVYAQTNNGLNLPGFYSLDASVDPVSASSKVEKSQTNSVYGKIGLSWRNGIFVEVTGRNDWVSTLAASERSYFYPSVAGSVVISEFIPLPEVFGFWKVRSSWTQTKTPAGIYAINQTYGVSRNYWGNMTATSYPSSIRDVTLKPNASVAYEIGTDMRFFDGRLKLDATYYNKLDYNRQTYATMSYTSGFESTLINYGEENLSRGVEIALSGDILKSSAFAWNSAVNWTAARYTYHKLDELYSAKKPWVAEGKDSRWLEMWDWEKDPAGNLILYNGLPKRSAYPTLMGSTNPSWYWGWANSFRYKNITLAFSFDGRVGGMMTDHTESRLWHSGRHIDSDNQWRYDEVMNGGKYVVPGVKIVSGDVKYDTDGNITEDTRVFAPNDTEVSYENYKRRTSETQQTSLFLRSKTFIKLRELSISYAIPKTIYSKLGMKGANVALTGQNLFVWNKDVRFSDIDSESETINSPSIRYVGVNIKLNF